MKNTARVIVRYAEDNKILQKEAAAKLGLDPAHLSKWLSSTKPVDMNPSTLQRLVNRLHDNPALLEEIMKAYMLDKFGSISKEFEVVFRKKGELPSRVKEEPEADPYLALSNSAREQQIDRGMIKTLIQLIDKIPQSKWLCTALKGLAQAPGE